MPMMVDRVRIVQATGISDALAYRARRQELLHADRLVRRDPVEHAALDKRLRELAIRDPRKLQVLTLMYYNDYRFDINGPAAVVDPAHQLQGELDTSQDWPLAFWMGAWDSDALCGYVQGMLTIPFVSHHGEGQYGATGSLPTL